MRQVVISPGSRNAPLILGFTGDPYFECFSIVDERSAAFFALGLSQQSGYPSVLVCTSGSALLNYYPAVAEAYYSRIPIVVLSADRPAYKIDIGDGQTIRQTGAFSEHIGYQASLLQDVTHATEAIRWEGLGISGKASDLDALQSERQQVNEKLINQALQTAQLHKLPVHLNVPFEEPLYNTSERPLFVPKASQVLQPHEKTSDWEVLTNKWVGFDRKMVLLGALPPGKFSQDILDRLAEDPSVLVFTETTSNVHHPAFFPSVDTLMAPLEVSDDAERFFESLQPNLLVTMGGMIVSKKIKQFLRRFPPAEHWHVDPYRAYDTFYNLNRHIQMEGNDFFKSLLPKIGCGKMGFRKPWEEYRENYKSIRGSYFRQIPFTDLSAFYDIIRSIPRGVQVQLANSSTVRYAQLFDMHPSNSVFCNRGTSGIEGSTSTAVGAALNSSTPVILISGDLSFLYDKNGLWNNYLRPDMRFIVLNNQGGGIFRILPGKEDNEVFETYFETVQDVSLSGLCHFYGLEHRSVASREDLSTGLKGFFDPSKKPRLLEIVTPRKLNDEVLLGYFDFLTSAIPDIT